MADQVQHRGAHRCDAVGLQQALELLLNAFFYRPFPEAVAAGDKKGRHQSLTVDKGEKGCQRQSAADLYRVKLGSVGQHDGDHAQALQQVEHPDGIVGAGFGAFHEKGPSLRRAKKHAGRDPVD